MTVIIKTEPGDTEVTTILPDPACGGPPIKGEDLLWKEEEQEQTISKEEIEPKAEEKEKVISKEEDVEDVKQASFPPG